MVEPQPISTGEKNDSVAYEMAMRLPQLLIIIMYAEPDKIQKA